MRWLSDLLDIIFEMFNSTLQFVVGLLSQDPESFNATLYQFAENLSFVFQSVGVALVVLFFFLSLADPSRSIGDIKRPEVVLAEFVRLIVCNIIVLNSSFILEKIMQIGTGLITLGWNTANSASGGVPTLSADGTVKAAMNEIEFGILDISFDMLILLLLGFIWWLHWEL